jgi:CRISPR type IV-associated protein Csf3
MLTEIPDIVARVSEWGPLELAPLRVTLRLANPRAGYDALHLDGLLSYGLVVRALGHSRLDGARGPYHLPLPLRCLWRDQEGLPLWAVTDMQPQGVQAQGTATWTRRAIDSRLVASADGRPYAPRTTQGPYKDMMIPLPIEVAESWTCDVVGDARIIADLLRVLQSVGKKSAQGWGRVMDWTLEPLDAWRITSEQGRLRRAVPCAALGADPLRGQLLGWTPPYWRNQTLCLAPGEAAQIPTGW